MLPPFRFLLATLALAGAVLGPPAFGQAQWQPIPRVTSDPANPPALTAPLDDIRLAIVNRYASAYSWIPGNSTSTNTGTVGTTPPVTPPAAIATPSGTAPTSGLGNGNAAALVQAQAEVQATMTAAYGATNPTPPTGAFGTYVAIYRQFNSTPLMYAIGLPLGQILQSNYFQVTLWALMLLTVSVSISQHLRKPSEAQTDFYVGLVLKLSGAIFVLAAPDLIYATCMTVQSAGVAMANGMQQMQAANASAVASRMSSVLSQAGTQDAEVQTVLRRAVANGLSDRVGIFTRWDAPNSTAEDQAATDFFATFFNAVCTGTPPAVNSSVTPNWTFTPAGSTTPYATSGAAFNITSLSAAITAATAPITSALGQTDLTSNGQAQRGALISQYSHVVRDTTSNWVDAQIIEALASAAATDPRLAKIVADIGPYSKRANLATVADPVPQSIMDKIVDWLGTAEMALAKIVVSALARVVGFGLALLLELSILGLMCAVPLWFLEGTKKAFTGAVETLLACTIVLPMYLFFQVILDAMFVALKAMALGTLS